MAIELANAIEAKNLTKKYDKLLAVDHINFEAKRGEIFGFLGPNGAGKTTTIRMLTGISKPTDGTATIMGHDIQRHPIDAKEQGFARSMKRRVCISMALMNQANIVFLDEPTSGLDVQSVLIIREMIRELNQKGLTIFITTHNLEEASQMCDRVAIINHGKIAAIGTPKKLKRTVQGLQSVEVAFAVTPADALKDLEKLPSTREVVKEGDKFRLFTDDSSKVLASVWAYSQSNN